MQTNDFLSPEFAVFDLTLLYTFPWTSAHTSCYVVACVLLHPHTYVMLRCYGFCESPTRPSWWWWWWWWCCCCAPFFRWCPVKRSLVFILACPQMYWRFLYWPVPRRVDSFILACPQVCASHEYVQGGGGPIITLLWTLFFWRCSVWTLIFVFSVLRIHRRK